MILSAEAKLGCRAAVAVIIALVISHVFHLNRGYWAVLTTLALISQSWGESLQKAYTRFGMTITGCIVGYLLFLFMGHPQWLILSCLLIGIFGMAYFFVVSYAWAMFFVGLIVVAIFVYLGVWSLEVLWERIYETAIGCAVAAVVTGLFMPIYARQTFYQDLSKTVKCFAEIMSMLTNRAIAHQTVTAAENTQHLNKLFLQIKSLSKEYSTAKYEMMILLQKRKSMDLFLHKFEISFHYLSSLAGVLRVMADQPIYAYFEIELKDLWQYLGQKIDRINQGLENKKVENLEIWEDSAIRIQLRENFIKAKHEQKFDADQMMYLTACVYYGRMLDRALYEMLNLLITEQVS